MAKQDLVVKLMLDSGAFGNDIRQAERRAQDFSNKMKSAGDTAGKFTNEIGLSAGAFSKLGGILTGAGGVVAAVGAFKSVMESTHGSAMKFKGIIGGFDNVLETFQESLATMDFTTLLEGLDEAYRRGKKYAELQMEVARAAVAYNLLDNRDRRDYKAIELKYREATTDSARAAAKKEAEKLIAAMRERVSSFTDIVNEEFIAGVIKGDSKIKEGSIDVKTALELLYQAAEHINSGYYKTDQSEYNRIQREIEHIDYVLKGGAAQLGTLHEREGEAQMFRWASDANEAAYQAAKKAREDFERVWNNRDFYKKLKNSLIDNNQSLFFRNELYKMGAEELQNIVNSLEQSFGKAMAIDELELQLKGWSAPTTPKKTTGGSTGGSTKTTKEIKNMEGSIAKINEDIAKAKELRDSYLLGSDAWLEEAAKVASLERQLKSMEAQMEKLLSKYNREPLPVLPDLIDQWTENAKNKNNGLAVPKGYKREGGLIVKDAELPQIKSIDNIIGGLENMNSVLSASIMLTNGLSDAFGNFESDSAKNLAGITDIMSTVASGIMGFLQIQQTAIATNEAYAASVAAGQAAALPYPANLMAMATALGTVISIFAKIKQLTAGKFAEGGIVGGTSYSGDKLFAMVNSGEMILNKRQQGNLANMLGGGGQVEFHISGDSLVGVLNNRQNKRNLTR